MNNIEFSHIHVIARLFVPGLSESRCKRRRSDADARPGTETGAPVSLSI
jgi:hypothetical protein